MNAYSDRNPPIASVTSVTERGPAAIPRIAPVEAVAPHADTAADQPRTVRTVPEAAVDAVHEGDDQARSHADYAKVHEEIASILSSLAASPSAYDSDPVGTAESALANLMPEPTIVLPLPPASDAMVAFINQVRQSIVAQSARTRAAMSNVGPAMVDAAIA